MENNTPPRRFDTEPGNLFPGASSSLPRSRPRHHCFRTFSLVEILVVVLIMTIVLAIAIPLYAASQKNAKLSACRAQIVAVYQAEETHRVRNRDYTTTLSNLNTTLGALPTCPADGSSYTATKTGSGSTLSVTIRCNAATGKHGSNPVLVNGSFTGTGASAGTP